MSSFIIGKTIKNLFIFAIVIILFANFPLEVFKIDFESLRVTVQRVKMGVRDSKENIRHNLSLTTNVGMELVVQLVELVHQ